MCPGMVDSWSSVSRAVGCWKQNHPSHLLPSPSPSLLQQGPLAEQVVLGGPGMGRGHQAI